MNIFLESHDGYHYVRVFDEKDNEIRENSGVNFYSTASLISSQLLKFLKSLRDRFGPKMMVFQTKYYNAQRPFMEVGDQSKMLIDQFIEGLDDDHVQAHAETKTSKDKTVTATVDGDMYVCRFKYVPAVRDAIKKVEGRKYNMDDKTWSVPRVRKRELKEQINSIGYHIEFE